MRGMEGDGERHRQGVKKYSESHQTFMSKI